MTAKSILHVKKKSGFNNYKEVIILTGWFKVGSIDYILNPTLDISSIDPAKLCLHEIVPAMESR